MTNDHALDNIDWPLLRDQKQVLLKVVYTEVGLSITRSEVACLEGILNLLDSLQNYAVVHLGVPESDAFAIGNKEED